MRFVLYPLLLMIGAAVAEEAASPVPLAPPSLEIAPVDVEANVRRMLDEARRREAQQGSGDEGQRIPEQDTGVTPLPSSPAAVPAPATAPPAPVGPAAPPALVRRPTAAPVNEDLDGHVPLPEKEITIRDLQDVGTLREELGAARERKLGAGTPPAEQSPPRKAGVQ